MSSKQRIKNHNKHLTSLFIETKTQLDKAYALLADLRSGKHYYNSNLRNDLLQTYGNIIQSLSDEEFVEFKAFLITKIPELIKDRNEQKIAYSALAELIKNSNKQGNLDIYKAYKNHIFLLAGRGYKRHSDLVMRLADISYKLTGELNEVEEFILARYIHPFKRYISINYLYNYLHMVDGVDKKKMFFYLVEARPFWQDASIISWIANRYPELQKYAIML